MEPERLQRKRFVEQMSYWVIILDKKPEGVIDGESEDIRFEFESSVPIRMTVAYDSKIFRDGHTAYALRSHTINAA